MVWLLRIGSGRVVLVDAVVEGRNFEVGCMRGPVRWALAGGVRSRGRLEKEPEQEELKVCQLGS